MIDETPRTPDDHDATLKPPQFSLRTLLIGTTAVAGLLGLMMTVGTVWSIGILLFVTLIAAHVIGNSLGTRLRDGSTRRPFAAQATVRRANAASQTVALPTRLRERRRLHWMNLVLTLAGAGVGGYFGGSALADNYPEATNAARVLAYLSSAVLGGFAVFAVSSFATVVRQAVHEAHAGSDRQRP